MEFSNEISAISKPAIEELERTGSVEAKEHYTHIVKAFKTIAIDMLPRKKIIYNSGNSKGKTFLIFDDSEEANHFLRMNRVYNEPDNAWEAIRNTLNHNTPDDYRYVVFDEFREIAGDDWLRSQNYKAGNSAYIIYTDG